MLGAAVTETMAPATEVLMWGSGVGARGQAGEPVVCVESSVAAGCCFWMRGSQGRRGDFWRPCWKHCPEDAPTEILPKPQAT